MSKSLKKKKELRFVKYQHISQSEVKTKSEVKNRFQVLHIQLHPQAPHTSTQERQQLTLNSTKNDSLSTSLSIFRQKNSLNVGLSISNKRITAPSRALAGDVMQ